MIDKSITLIFDELLFIKIYYKENEKINHRLGKDLYNI